MDLLKKKNKTPEEVASALGVSPRAVYYWIAGSREARLTIAQVQALCELLDCDVRDIPATWGPMQSAGSAANTPSAYEEKGGDYLNN